MALALTLGRRGTGRTWPNPAVGALVVKDGLIVGRGWTQPGGRPHAESEALMRAGTHARGATLYVTLEPCTHEGKTPPCTESIVAAKIARVVSAMVDPNPLVAGAGHWQLAERGIVVEVGVCADEARRAHAGHIRRMRDGRPHVCVKLAVSADGKIALAAGRPTAITAEQARRRVHLMRAMSDAVVTGISTVLADDPQLTCRLPGMPSPARVVLDSRLRLPLASKLVTTMGLAPLWVFAGPPASAEREQALAAHGVEVHRVEESTDGLGLAMVLSLLAQRGITRMMLEAGPKLTTAFLAANLIDELALFRSPIPIGEEGTDALEGLPLCALLSSAPLQHIATETIGPDLLEFYERT
jgi:diaminohydroxyphosphoribosylaminopyrimidine deaminase / 5-amino-6-(5-phosphoribosylamino)uracil reductase